MKRILTFFVFLYGYTLSQGQSDTLYRSLAHEGLQREYLLYVPEAYDGTEDWPLVLNFHGYATSAFTQMVFSDMNPVADTAHFLIAYPQGTEFTSSVPGTPERGLGFSIGGPGDTTFSSVFNPDDVDFASKIIDDIANDYKVDLSRVYSTGWSNGGFLSTILANELSDRIAAIAPLGGAIPRSRPFAPTTPVPTLYIHGTADAIAPYGGSDFTRSVEEVLETWTTLNACDVEPTVTRLPDLTEADASTVDLITWQNCGTPVQHLRVNDGGHQWFGGPNIFPFLGNISLDIHASSEIWNFFSQFSLPSAADYVLPEPKIRPLEKTIEVGGVEREYLLYVPESYDESEETPLVFVYHGADFPVEAQVDVSIMNPVADTAGFIVAYPKSLVVFDATFEVLTSSWTYPGNTGEHDDVEFTREMIDEISSEYNINLSKVYATGWSAGSEFSFHLACVLPDQIAAVAGVGGQMRTPAFDACTASERAVPILQMHGTADVVLPFEGLLDYPSALETIEFWANRNGCSTTPASEELPNLAAEDNSSVTLLTYDNCEHGAEVLFYQIEGGGHNWSGGPLPFALPFLRNVNLDINASSEIWNFFSRQSLPPFLGTADNIREFEAVRIFPNPASTSTQVRLDMSEPAAVQISIQDISGEVVLQQNTGVLPLGYNEINLDLSDVSNGSYFLTLLSTDRVLTLPLIVSKDN